jgi:hypothetical protein
MSGASRKGSAVRTEMRDLPQIRGYLRLFLFLTRFSFLLLLFFLTTDN